jgi:hypothetical protein
MMRARYVGLLATLAAMATASAGDYPLNFRTIPAKDVMAFPGGSGASGTLLTGKPATLKKEPKAVSAHPIYGQCRAGRGGPTFVFRLDESKGDGKGYDRLIMDMNQNGDLTDDAVVQRVTLSTDRRVTTPDMALWGPIEAPADKKIDGGRPVYYAQTYLYNTELLRRSPSSRSSSATISFLGQLQLKAGWYLDTTVELNGRKQKVGVYDGNGNFRLGDAPQMVTYTNRESKSWSSSAGDSVLVDADGSGTFDNDLFQSESFAFGPIVYFGPQAYKLALAADCTSMHLEPWTEALADVALVPRGDQVRTVTLVWQRPSESAWQLLIVGTKDGKIQVPPGKYQLYSCELLGNAGSRDQVMASGSLRTVQKPVQVAVGQANSLRCGAPLEIKVTAEKSKASATLLSGLLSRESKTDSDAELRINAAVFGAGGESYSSYRKGEKLRTEPTKPTFFVLDSRGRKVKDGNLEFG